ncbi:MAG: pilus assembly protein N-terminal domain-containing protein [Bauldia sp.]|nr:pilus assembly protein N-terminal domain-containing protein [Bauldia sp.]
MPRQRIPFPTRRGGAMLRGGLILAAALAAGSQAAVAAEHEPISVVIDRAKVMRISRPADIVIIGNPAIADATIQDNRTLIITGRAFGTTNLIVLDASGEAIADEVLTVTGTNDGVVTVFKRANRETLSCTPDCSPTMTIGDRPDTFAATTEQIKAHTEISAAAAE